MRFLHSSIVPKYHCARAAFTYLSDNTNTDTYFETEQMAYQTNLTQSASHSIADKFAAFMADYRAKAARRKLYRETLNELRALSARDLADLGLHKSMIHRVAYQAAYEK